MKTFKEHLNEMAPAVGGLEYEMKVYKALIKAKIPGLNPGDIPGAGFSNVGHGDIEATLDGTPFNIEIKSSALDQMGGTSLRYDRDGQKFTAVAEQDMDPEDLKLLLDVAKTKKKALNEYIDAARKMKPVKFHKTIDGVPIKVSVEAREALKKRGLLREINATVTMNERFIVKHYNKKKVYYIQIGGAGLFYLGKNPLDLPIPALKGEIQVEFRLGYSGKKLTFPTNPPIDARSAGLRIQGRLRAKGKSAYSLDDPKSIFDLFMEYV